MAWRYRPGPVAQPGLSRRNLRPERRRESIALSWPSSCADIGPQGLQLCLRQHVSPRRHPPFAFGDRGVEALPLLTWEMPQIVGVLARIHHIRTVAIQAELLVGSLPLLHQFGWESVGARRACTDTAPQRHNNPESQAEERAKHS